MYNVLVLQLQLYSKWHRRSSGIDRQTNTQTDKQDDYYNSYLPMGRVHQPNSIPTSY